MGTVLFLILFFGIGGLLTPKAKISDLASKEYEETRE